MKQPCLHSKRVALASVGLLLFCAAAASAADYPGLAQDPETPPANSLDGAAAEFLDVPYLDDARDTLTYGGWPKSALAYRSRLNVHVPSGEGPFPCLIYVHGGGYGGGHGTKFTIWNRSRFNDAQVDPAKEGIRRGYVLVCFNYILGRGIHPQVQRDFKEAVRFLRANRAKFKIDPNRIGAIGASAGGWLITSAGLTTADDFGQRSQRSHNIAELVADPNAWSGKAHYPISRRKGESILYSSFDETEPRHAEISSRLNALAFDFSHQLQSVTPDDPELLSIYAGLDAWWTRKGKDLTNLDLLKQKFTLIDYGKYNAEKFTRNGRLPGVLHVPSHNMPVPSADGKGPVPAAIRIFQFFDKQLKNSARTPTAEARPNARFFKDNVEVTFATAGPDTTVHFTLDGSEPTLESPVAGQPVRLDATTTVKFISVVSGLAPSGVAAATFIKGEALPRVTSPDVSVLPIATVGKPYEVQFEAAGATRWHFQLGNPGLDKEKEIIATEGREAFYEIRNRNYNLYHVGLDVNPATGRMFGTPRHPGTYVLQVVTARDTNDPGGCRVFTLVVLPSGA